MARTVTILTLLLIATPSINSADSSLQQEVSIQNTGDILFSQDNFTETIFFEYGAESGELQPPFDVAGPMGSGDKSGSYVQVDNAHVRTGAEAVEFYQIPSNKSDAQRRVELRYHNTRKEFYLSWWVYFPDNMEEDTPSWGTTLGGFQSFFGPQGINKWLYWTGFRFGSSPSRTIIVSYRPPFKNYDGGGGNSQSWSTSYNIGDYLNQWVHFQMYVKWAIDYTGVYRAWINNDLVAELTGIKNDPQSYDLWYNDPENGEECIYASGYPYPFIVNELYQSQNSPERWYWIDDIVGADEKVPDTYGVSN